MEIFNNEKQKVGRESILGESPLGRESSTPIVNDYSMTKESNELYIINMQCTLYKLKLGLGGTGQNDRTTLPEGDRLGLVRVTEGNPK